jgi:hypothetical protein
VLGALFGRKKLSVSSLGRATTAAREVGRSMKEAEDIGRARETVAALQQQYQAMEQEMESEIATLMTAIDPQTERLDTVELKPKKTNISIKLLALVWRPAR